MLETEIPFLPGFADDEADVITMRVNRLRCKAVTTCRGRSEVSREIRVPANTDLRELNILLLNKYQGN